MQAEQFPEIDNVEILCLIGQGGMSRVFKARQLDLDRLVAVKVLNKISDPDAIQRFKNEAVNTSLLDHPHIVKPLAFGLSKNQQPFLLMEYLEGCSLAEVIKQQGSIDYRRFRNIFLSVLSALESAHQKEIVHRDIKPGNIMLCRDSDGKEQAKLVDFGIAKTYQGEANSQNLTKSGAVLGSPTYMSPEQCQGGALDKRSDLYSLSCVMYESLIGEPPFSGESVFEVMQKHVASPLPDLKEVTNRIEVNKDLLKTVMWGLEKLPESRPQSASSFAERLAKALEKITLDKIPLLRASDKNSLAISAVSVVSLLILVVFLLTTMKVSRTKSSSTYLQNEVKTDLSFRTESRLKGNLEEVRQKSNADPREVKNALIQLADHYHSTSWWHREALILEPLVSLTGKNDPAYTKLLIRLGRAYLLERKPSFASSLLEKKLGSFKTKSEFLQAGNLIVRANIESEQNESIGSEQNESVGWDRKDSIGPLLKQLRVKELDLSALDENKLETDFLNAKFLVLSGRFAEANRAFVDLIQKREQKLAQENLLLNKKQLSNVMYDAADFLLQDKKEVDACKFWEQCVQLIDSNTTDKELLQNSIESLEHLCQNYSKTGNLKAREERKRKEDELLRLSFASNSKKPRLLEYLRSLDRELQERSSCEDVSTWKLNIRQIDFLSKEEGNKRDALFYAAYMTKFDLMQHKNNIKGEDRLRVLNDCLRYSYSESGKATYETAATIFNIAMLGLNGIDASIENLKKAERILLDPQIDKLPLDTDFAQVRGIVNVMDVESAIGNRYEADHRYALAEQYYRKAMNLAGSDLRLKIDPAVKVAVLLQLQGDKSAARKELSSLRDEMVSSIEGHRYAEQCSFLLLDRIQKLSLVGLENDAVELLKAIRTVAHQEGLAGTKERINLYLENMRSLKPR